VSKSAIPVANPIAAKIPMKEVISIPLKTLTNSIIFDRALKIPLRNSFKDSSIFYLLRILLTHF